MIVNGCRYEASLGGGWKDALIDGPHSSINSTAAVNAINTLTYHFLRMSVGRDVRSTIQLRQIRAGFPSNPRDPALIIRIGDHGPIQSISHDRVAKLPADRPSQVQCGSINRKGVIPTDRIAFLRCGRPSISKDLDNPRSWASITTHGPLAWHLVEKRIDSGQGFRPVEARVSSCRKRSGSRQREPMLSAEHSTITSWSFASAYSKR